MQLLTVAFLAGLVLVPGGCVRPGVVLLGTSDVRTHMPADHEQPGELLNSNPTTQSNRTFAVIEFDDMGMLLDRSQLEKTYSRVESIKQTQPVLLLMFVHGWKHSAATNDSNLRSFHEFVRTVADMNLYNPAAKEYHVVGVYLGWRGNMWDHGKDLQNIFQVRTQLGYYNRDATAKRVAGVSATEVLLSIAGAAKAHSVQALTNIFEEPELLFGDDNKPSIPPDPLESKVIILGHSMGGLIVEKAVAQAAVGYMAAMTPQATIASLFKTTTDVPTIKSQLLGARVALTNSLAERNTLFQQLTNLQNPERVLKQWREHREHAAALELKALGAAENMTNEVHFLNTSLSNLSSYFSASIPNLPAAPLPTTNDELRTWITNSFGLTNRAGRIYSDFLAAGIANDLRIIASRLANLTNAAQEQANSMVDLVARLAAVVADLNNLPQQYEEIPLSRVVHGWIGNPSERDELKDLAAQIRVACLAQEGVATKSISNESLRSAPISALDKSYRGSLRVFAQGVTRLGERQRNVLLALGDYDRALGNYAPDQKALAGLCPCEEGSAPCNTIEEYEAALECLRGKIQVDLASADAKYTNSLQDVNHHKDELRAHASAAFIEHLFNASIPADLIILINPASSALTAAAFSDALSNTRINPRNGVRGDLPGPRPLIINVSSKADGATRTIFKLAHGLSGAFKRFSNPEQAELYRNTAPHVEKLLTHRVVMADGLAQGWPTNQQMATVREPAKKPEAFYLRANLLPENAWQDSDGLHELGSVHIAASRGIYSLVPENPQQPSEYWVVEVPKDLLGGHNEYWTADFYALLAYLVRVQKMYDAALPVQERKHWSAFPVAPATEKEPPQHRARPITHTKNWQKIQSTHDNKN